MPAETDLIWRITVTLNEYSLGVSKMKVIKVTMVYFIFFVMVYFNQFYRH